MLLKLFDYYAKFLTRLLIVLMTLLLISVATSVAGRYIEFIPRFFWILEITNFALIWMVFVGSILGLRESRHFFIDIFGDDVPKWFELVLKIVYYIVTLTVTYVFVRWGYRYFVEWGTIQTSDLTGINLGFLYASVPVAGISWLLFLLEGIYHDFLKRDRHEAHHMIDSYTIEHEDTDSQGGADR